MFTQALALALHEHMLEKEVTSYVPPAPPFKETRISVSSWSDVFKLLIEASAAGPGASAAGAAGPGASAAGASAAGADIWQLYVSEKCPEQINIKGHCYKKKDLLKELAPWSFKGFYLLCHVWQMNVLVEDVFNKKFCQIMGRPTGCDAIVSVSNRVSVSKRVSVHVIHPALTWAQLRLEYLKQTCQEIPDEIIHLKPMTHYLVRDLQDLAKRVDIPYLDEHGKALKKNVLYSALSVPI